MGYTIERNEKLKVQITMFAKLFIVVVSVQAFAPVSNPTRIQTTELNAFFFQKPTEKSPTLTLESEQNPSKFSNPFAKKSAVSEKKEKKVVVNKVAVAKKVAVKKTVAKKVAVKQTTSPRWAKSSTKTASLANGSKKKKLVIYERNCHIN